MLDLKEGTPLSMLRQCGVYLDGVLSEDFGISKLTVDNTKGKGSITLYEIIPGLTAWIYNIKFEEDFVLDLKFSDDQLYYFGYHLNGYQLQKFRQESAFKKINKRQNFLLIGDSKSSSEFILPKGIKIESCYIIISSNLIENYTVDSKRNLEYNLKELFGHIKEERPYRYFGNIDVNTGLSAKIIINNNKTDVVGRLLVEGSILNMLANQIEAHDNDVHTGRIKPQLSISELSKIADLGDYIKNNLSENLTVEELSMRIPITARKLQAGVKFLFGYSVNHYITNLRLELAKELIQNTDQSISEICYSVGYSSRSYFSKIFQERYNISPSQYKDQFINDNLIFEISYRSKAIKNITEKDVEDIIETARKMNAENNITGSLIYHNGMFFQIIEGHKSNIIQLYENIKNDKRHNDVQLMWQGYKTRKDFNDWNMALLTQDGVLQSISQGNASKISLSHLIGSFNEDALSSENLWRKVRNAIKLSTAG